MNWSPCAKRVYSNEIRTIEGHKGLGLLSTGSECLNLCSNNYLGFADHAELKEASRTLWMDMVVGPGL